jgi:hypothetical protein
MENLKKCLDVRMEFLDSTHPDVIATNNHIDQVNKLKQTLTHLDVTMNTSDNIHKHENFDDQALDLRIIKTLQN